MSRHKGKLLDKLPRIAGFLIDEHGKSRPVRFGPIRHRSLTPDQLKRIARLRDVLIDAYPMTLDGWLDGFLRDTNPDREIRLIEACASAYQHFAQQLELTADAKKTLYAVTCALTCGANPPDLTAALAKHKPLPALENLISVLRHALAQRDLP